mgnify:CR=1 FL=1
MTTLTPILFIGADSDEMRFETKSWTRTNLDVVHEIAVCKRTGLITCSCENAVYRRKHGHVIDRSEGCSCKHIARLMHTIGGVLRPTEETKNGTEN